MFAEDLSVFFDSAEFASAASWGAQSANVILDTPSEDVIGGRAQGVAYEATLPSSSFPGIARGAVVLIESVPYAAAGYVTTGYAYDARDYVVREVRLLDDGRLKKLALGVSP